MKRAQHQEDAGEVRQVERREKVAPGPGLRTEIRDPQIQAGGIERALEREAPADGSSAIDDEDGAQHGGHPAAGSWRAQRSSIQTAHSAKA